MKYRWCFVFVLLLFGQTSWAESLPASAQQFLNNYCVDCHNPDLAEASLDLSKLDFQLDDASLFARWERLHDRVERGEMPPKDADQPSLTSRQMLLKPLAEKLTAAHQKTKGTVLRRLNRQEYENTLNDLFGQSLNLKILFPEDGRSHEFDTVGANLSISAVQMQKYLEAADLVLNESIATRTSPPETKTIRVSYADMSGADKFIGSAWLKRPDNAVVFFRRLGYPSGMLREANAPVTGHYKIRVTGYAYQSDRPVTFSVGGTSFARGSEKPIYGFFAFPPGKPTTIELTAHMEARYMVEITPFGISDPQYLIKKNGIENYKGPGLAILNVEVEGPLIDQFPSRGHELIFHGINRREIEPKNPKDKQRPYYVPKFELVSDNPERDVRNCLENMAEHLFRRPVQAGELDRYVDLFETEWKAGASPEEALKTAHTALLCSPQFLYLQENPGPLDDYQLASRLAYFLTRTAPDETLLAVARQRKLTADPAALRAQAERLLKDEKLERMIIDFTDAWLNLREIEFTNPDGDLFPEFDQYLQYSMLAESRSFFRELLQTNAAVGNIVKSDFAMLNERLAEHYDVPGVSGPEIRRVKLPRDHVRGGILTQGSVLKVSANGTNTSPVVRGVWVLERILGEHAPPPPPGVPGVEPDIRGASTLRELLDKHRDLDSCRACHQLIDPPGFALESFNPIGGYRDRYRSLGEGERVDLIIEDRKVRYKLGPLVDPSGETLNGDRFQDYRQFRDLLAAEEEVLARTMVQKFLTFATGRELGFSDRVEVERIVQKSARNGYGMRDLILNAVDSPLFRSK